MNSQKAVGDLVEEEYKFFIPFYQRGYRWEENQIKALLNDLWEFHRKLKQREEGYKYYSLQPLVVKKDNEKYIVIDGQQRLTTLYLIISACEDILGTAEDKFSIEYDREGSEAFLSNIAKRKDQKNHNIDYCYMTNGYETILSWIEKKEISKSNLKSFRDFIQRDSDIINGVDENENIRFIWYEISEHEEEFDVFIRLNIGKIPLTNAELIKSFVIQKDGQKEKRFEISKEWDDIEYSLQNNELFGFLTTKRFNTRIEILFQILLAKEKYKEYELYEGFIDVYKDKNAKAIWDEIRDIYHILKFWYEDRELYHLIGYLVSIGDNISSIYNDVYRKSSNKNDFRYRLKQRIKDSLDIDIHNEELFNLEYSTVKEKGKIKNILLLFNVATLINSTGDTYIKFSFDKFNKEDWSLEHITPQTDKLKGNNKKIIEELKSLDINSVSKALADKEKLEDEDIKEIESLFIDEEFKSKEKKDNIRNLTLLSTKNNTSLSNGFFPVKRNKIINMDKTGAFIPIVTKNIFLKYYSDINNDEPLKWRYLEDGEKYVTVMKENLETFFKGLGDNHE